MTHPIEIAPPQACVWMSAGVLSYKLCDRHFDCEHCPLDAALRGGTADLANGQRTARAHHRASDVIFPADRLYSEAHTWLQRVNQGRFRFGMDSFAAALIDAPIALHWNDARRDVGRGASIVTLELDNGYLNLTMPLPARIEARNAALDQDAGLLLDEPYGAGWIAELEQVDPGQLARLLHADAAQARARLDLRRLRRLIALHLLAAADDGPLDCHRFAPSCCILDGAHYLELLRELVH